MSGCLFFGVIGYNFFLFTDFFLCCSSSFFRRIPAFLVVFSLSLSLPLSLVPPISCYFYYFAFYLFLHDVPCRSLFLPHTHTPPQSFATTKCASTILPKLNRQLLLQAIYDYWVRFGSKLECFFLPTCLPPLSLPTSLPPSFVRNVVCISRHFCAHLFGCVQFQIRGLSFFSISFSLFTWWLVVSFFVQFLPQGWTYNEHIRCAVHSFEFFDFTIKRTMLPWVE